MTTRPWDHASRDGNGIPHCLDGCPCRVQPSVYTGAAPWPEAVWCAETESWGRDNEVCYAWALARRTKREQETPW